MNQTPITRSNNSEAGSFLLDVPLNLVTIPHWLSDLTDRQGYKTKEEYHVTVIGLELASLIRDAGKDEEVQSLIDSFAWTIEISNAFVELAKDDANGVHRQSIICIVTVPQLVEFYEKLKGLLNTDINVPPAHITLFTKNYDRGIGLYSDADLNRYKIRDLRDGSKY